MLLVSTADRLQQLVLLVMLLKGSHRFLLNIESKRQRNQVKSDTKETKQYQYTILLSVVFLLFIARVNFDMTSITLHSALDLDKDEM